MGAGNSRNCQTREDFEVDSPHTPPIVGGGVEGGMVVKDTRKSTVSSIYRLRCERLHCMYVLGVNKGIRYSPF